MQTIIDFCSVDFFLFQGPTHNPSRDVLYCLGKKVLNSWENSQFYGKILSSWENSQLLRKVSTLEKIFNSSENSQLFRKFSTLVKILNSWQKSKLLGKLSALKKVLSSWENYQFLGNYQLKRKLLTQEKNNGERKSKKQQLYIKSFIKKEDILQNFNYLDQAYTNKVGF